MIPGIDVSKWQGEIDWVKVANAGVRFAYIKATEGTGYTDPCFTVNWKSAQSAGLLRGAYHYFHPRLDARTQARAMITTLGNDCGELPPAVDLETPELTGAALMTSLSTFLQELENFSGLTPMIYTSPGFWSSYATPYPPEWPANYPLWIAHYGVGRPSIPYPWINFTFWQATNRAEVTGITRFPVRRPRVDLNWFNGSQTEMDAFRIS